VTLENNDNAKTPISDKDKWALLVADIAERNDRDAFKCLYNYFAPRVKSFMLRSGLKEGAAEEIAQETLLTVWRKSAQFNGQLAGVSTWIFTIARNKKIDKFRKDSKPLPDANDPSFGTQEEMTPEQQFSQSMHAEKLNKALALLPADQRAVLIASFIQDNPHKDIAKELDIPLGTVKSRIRLGLTKLRSLMGEFEGGL
jgi:RNA polymerase sigma-70 factor (ECF subfamily)